MVTHTCHAAYCKYNLNYLNTGLAAFVTIGLFVDFYLWDMSPRQVFIDVTSLGVVSYDYLLTNGSYQLQPILHYSFGLQCGGIMAAQHVTIMYSRGHTHTHTHTHTRTHARAHTHTHKPTHTNTHTHTHTPRNAPTPPLSRTPYRLPISPPQLIYDHKNPDT